MPQSLSIYWTFFREFRRRFKTTGAVAPSGRFLAAALARPVLHDAGVSAERPRRILEVGPGTGAVTDHIVAAMRETDQLDLVDVNEKFVALLRRRFAREQSLQSVAERVRILHCPVEDIVNEGPYDVIVSGLPLNNFAADDVADILDALDTLLLPNGQLSFFEYIAIRRLRRLFAGRRERNRMREIGTVLTTFLDCREAGRVAVWCNILPAWVHYVTSKESNMAGYAP